MWMLSAEAQLKRAGRSAHRGEMAESLSEVRLETADLELCLVALVRFRRAFVLLRDLHPELPDSPFLRRFDEAAPDLAYVRDVAEHWDAYARGAGRKPPKEQRGRQYKWGKDGVVVYAGDKSVNVTRAVEAARAIVEWLSKAMNQPAPPPVADP